MTSHTAVNTSDSVYVCGGNKHGQLGLGDNDDRNVLTKLQHFQNENVTIVSVHCGGLHTIIHATDSDGSSGIYACGWNRYGQLGLGDFNNRDIPTKILDFQTENLKIISIHCGPHTTILNTKDSRGSNGVYVFGCNEQGQLGLGDTNNRNVPTKLNFDHDIVSIQCGNSHTIFHTTDSQGSNSVYVCGANDMGQLGLVGDHNRNIPTKLNLDHDIISIHCGDFHSIFNTTDSQGSNVIYGCGLNLYGQLGLGPEPVIKEITKLNFDHDVLSIQCGNNYTMFLVTNHSEENKNTIYVCGLNQNGQLGLGNTINRRIPTKLNFEYEILSVQCWGSYISIYTVEGMYVCGNNSNGQLGLGDNDIRTTLTKLQFDHEFLLPNILKRFKTTKSARISN